MLLESIPFRRLASANRILVAGAGGGYDVFCGLPIAHALHAAGKHVALANLSITHLAGTDAPRLAPALFAITPETRGGSYFPERCLAEHLAHVGLSWPVYAIDKMGVGPVREAYREIIRRERVDAIVLVDGGTDILMRGDEAGLGTPTEDMTSLAAVFGLDAGPTEQRIVACLGFGIDAFHGVCHAHFLENVAAIARDGGYLGAVSLLAEMPEFALLRDAVAHTHAQMRPSIVNASIVSAVEGAFGDQHTVERTRGSELFINPLMGLYWAFDLEAVARRVLYLAALEGTHDVWDVERVIEAFRAEARTRPRTAIPV
jgi:hypothetical protein